MDASTPRPIEIFLAALPSWLLVTGGAAMLAAGILVPASIETHRQLHQRDHMRQQAAAMTQLAGDYQTFDTALADHDPVVLERLAFAQLRRKLIGVDPLTVQRDVNTLDNWMRNASTNASSGTGGEGATQLAEPPPAVASVESLIGDPAVIANMPMPTYEPPRNRLVRLTTGTMRLGFMIAAAGLVLAGLLWNPASLASPDAAADDDDADAWVMAELDEDDAETGDL